MAGGVTRAAALASHDAGAIRASESIVSLFTDAVKGFGERNAFMFQDAASGAWEHMTFAQAGTRVEHIGEGLAQLGIGSGDRVAILANSRVEWGLADYAALGNGSVVVPIYQTNSAEEVLHVLKDSGARSIILEDAEQLAKVNSIRHELPDLQHVIVMDPSAQTAGVKTLAEVEDAGSKVATGGWRDRAAAVTRDDLATIIYTSGTTGAPKGSLLTHGNYTAVVDALAGAENLFNPNDRVVLFLPLAHTFARSINFAGAATGMEVAYSTPKTILADLKAIKPTIMPSVPRIFEKANAGITAKLAEQGGVQGWLARKAVDVGARHYAAVESGGRASLLLRAQNALAEKLVLPKVRPLVQESFGGELRMAFSGGAPLDRGIQSTFGALGVPIHDAYGMTEVPAISMNLPGASRLGTVGKAVPGLEVKVGEGEELLVRGPQVFSGYNGIEGGVDAEGWLHTGDQVSISDDGFITITGRIKDLLKTSGGKYLQPAAFETTMKGNPFISNAMLYGDNRNFPSAMVTLNDEEIARWAGANGVKIDGAAGDNEQVQHLVQGAIDRYNATVSDAEGVKKFRILTSDLSQDAGEVTPTLKVKRPIVQQHFGDLLDQMYEPGAPDVGTISRPA